MTPKELLATLDWENPDVKSQLLSLAPYLTSGDVPGLARGIKRMDPPLQEAVSTCLSEAYDFIGRILDEVEPADDLVLSAPELDSGQP